MNSRFGSFLRGVKYLIWCVPLLFLIIPLPFATPAIETDIPMILSATTFALFIFVFLLSRLIAANLPARGVCISLYWLIPGLTLLLAFLLRQRQFELPLFVAISPVVAVLLFVVLFHRLEKSLSGGGPLSLLLFISFVLSLELGLGAIPQALLLPEVKPENAKLSRYNRAVETFDKNGFRGRVPTPQKTGNGLRIFTTGGSSTYGIPLQFSAGTYPAVLETILAERHPGENHQIFNAGVAGFGVTQIIDALERRIVAHKPDIVTICAWFNDAAMGPGWYGFPGKSEAEALQILKTLERLNAMPIVGPVLRSRLFLWYRYFLTQAKSAWMAPKNGTLEKRRRMEPDEFAEALRQIVALGAQHDFLPVFVFEPEHRSLPPEIATSRNRYFQAITKVALELDMPLVDTLRAFAERSSEWLHYDIIHFNEEGHRLIAEAIYQKLFVELGGTARSRTFLAGRGVIPMPHNVQREVVQQWARKAQPRDGKISVLVRAPYQPRIGDSEAALRVGVYSGTKRVHTIEQVGNTAREVQIDLNLIDDTAPITELTFRADTLLDEALGNASELFTDLQVPAWIELSSNGNSASNKSGVMVNGRKIVTYQQGYQFVVLGAKTGRIVALRHLPATQSISNVTVSELQDILSRSAEEGEAPLLFAALGGMPPAMSGGQPLSDLFKRCGGSGALPRRGESFLFAGACDRPEIKAYENRGAEPLFYKVGSRKQALTALLEVTPFASQGHLRTYYR